MPLLGFLVLLTGLWDLKGIPNSRQNRSSKNILVSENAVERVHAWKLLVPSYGLLTRTVTKLRGPAGPDREWDGVTGVAYWTFCLGFQSNKACVYLT